MTMVASLAFFHHFIEGLLSYGAGRTQPSSGAGRPESDGWRAISSIMHMLVWGWFFDTLVGLVNVFGLPVMRPAEGRCTADSVVIGGPKPGKAKAS